MMASSCVIDEESEVQRSKCLAQVYMALGRWRQTLNQALGYHEVSLTYSGMRWCYCYSCFCLAVRSSGGPVARVKGQTGQ